MNQGEVDDWELRLLIAEIDKKSINKVYNYKNLLSKLQEVRKEINKDNFILDEHMLDEIESGRDELIEYEDILVSSDYLESDFNFSDLPEELKRKCLNYLEERPVMNETDHEIVLSTIQKIQIEINQCHSVIDEDMLDLIDSGRDEIENQSTDYEFDLNFERTLPVELRSRCMNYLGSSEGRYVLRFPKIDTDNEIALSTIQKIQMEINQNDFVIEEDLLDLIDSGRDEIENSENEVKFDTNWNDLSPTLKMRCMEYLDFEDSLCLRATSRTEKSLIDSYRMKLDVVQLFPEEDVFMSVMRNFKYSELKIPKINTFGSDRNLIYLERFTHSLSYILNHFNITKLEVFEISGMHTHVLKRLHQLVAPQSIHVKYLYSNLLHSTSSFFLHCCWNRMESIIFENFRIFHVKELKKIPSVKTAKRVHFVDSDGSMKQWREAMERSRAGEAARR
ncbi:hypothetical protein CRE_21354 [Caenorhabditis remanei]|uniref:F-box domain-containing protein n=1 Tax=Caenorhabditis remanei TaxID=31234 RepID=E3MUW7_CAERE|nr:hypothetical protein CRE_21354 [Caenorhabditis remanei]